MKKIVLVLFMLFMSVNFAFAENADIKQLTEKADNGDVQAQYELGNCYFLGKGVDQDYKAAVYWNQKSAARGYAMAQYNLGFCYYKGQGVPQSIKHAYMWTSLALALTSNADEASIITDSLETIKADMTDAQIADAEQMAIKWQKHFEKAKK